MLILAALSYAGITAVFVEFERPGLGIGHLFYVPIVLIAFASGPSLGAAAGGLAAILYNVGIIINPELPSTLELEQTIIRLVTFVAIGILIGFFARRNRTLVAELSRLADRDSITGLPNTRVFQSAIERRLGAGTSFVLLVGDIDELRRINRESREEGDDALRRLADRLVAGKRADDEVARVGADEFAILASLDGGDARSLALGTENQLRLAGELVTFGWATYPQDGENALALYRAADERLYARKMARGLRRDVPVETPLAVPA
ncbi:MAG: diguanylate cyclase [Gaiellaceae bacterium]|jgi:diguanylate cyclase (GGDEF)-like protein|nr:diguanylate cyclase [Gaiellaceae bacterium]